MFVTKNKNINRNISTSYGIILYTVINNEIHYLICCRKNSFGYSDLLKGEYCILNQTNLKNIINELTNTEKQNIINNNYDYNWRYMWDYDPSKNLPTDNEYKRSKEKFILNRDNIIKLIRKTPDTWKTPEWEFPKGRINTDENYLECAIREFEEETGIKRKQINIIENILPFEEHFIGSNNKLYTYKYFLAYFDSKQLNRTDMDNFQKSEISDMKWLTYENCSKIIRPYNLEKIKLLNIINIVLEENRLYY